MLAFTSPHCLLLLTALLAAGCNHGPLSHSAGALSDKEVVAVFGSSAAFEAVRSPDRVEAWRIESKGPQAVGQFLDLYARRSEPHVVAPDIAQQLAQILENPASYDFHRAKDCEFDPGVQLHFVKGDRSVEVLLCFKCDELVVCQHGKRVGGEDFDNARPQLVALMKQIFPGDEAISKL